MTCPFSMSGPYVRSCATVECPLYEVNSESANKCIFARALHSYITDQTKKEAVDDMYLNFGYTYKQIKEEDS